MPAEMLTLEWFAEAYGWDPETVGRLDPEYADWYLRIADAKARVRRMKQDKKI